MPCQSGTTESSLMTDDDAHAVNAFLLPWNSTFIDSGLLNFGT